eukprot:TRINITY_DN18692_c0_g1_i1.p1 TRINITY_DN18692_c0_g1~~TRINITY_DN18692_c0_g1_i1.p1  ORF type:complete len:387 (+),score=100.92 TRINITY_DN18692_c0_g1_i1:88-1248(+)
MKLKRFLLRYEPPGVGLEVEVDGEVNVRHKECPPATEVTSADDICHIVDELISGEPELMSKRRHRPALLQLLGRLYQIDVTDAADNNAAPAGDNQPQSPSGAPKESARSEATDQEGKAESSDIFHEGQAVILIGLKGKLQVYNGELGTLVKVKAEKGKFDVQLSPTKADPQLNEVLKIKGSEHILICAPKGTQLAVGTHVAIRGLRNHIELNGCLGRVVDCHTEQHRYEVRATESGQLFRVKQENLVPIECSAHIPPAMKQRPAEAADATASSTTPRLPKATPAPAGTAAAQASAQGLGDGDDFFEPGSQVQLSGLKTAQQYNGQAAEVLSVDRARGRYEIRLVDGSVKTIRAENVILVSAPLRPSPRGKKARDSSTSGKLTDRGK